MSIIIMLICRRLGSVGPIQQKIKLPSPYAVCFTFLVFFWFCLPSSDVF